MKPRVQSKLFQCVVALLAAPSYAAEPAATADLGASALQMLFGLVIVLGLLLGTLWLLKRISQPRGAVAGMIRVVAGVAVGSRERVVIVELGNSWLVLGVAPGQVSTLAEIPRQELPDPPPATDFVGQLAIRLRRHA